MSTIRKRALDLLEARNLSATAIAGELGVERSAASHAIATAHKAGQVHIADYLRTGKDLAPVYGLGGGVDVDRPVPFDQSTYSAEYRARYPERNRASSRTWSERNVEYVRAKQAEYRARRRAAATVQAPPVTPVPVWSRTDEAVRIAPQLSGLHTPAFDRKPAMSESALTYFEIPEMPGVKRFACVKLHADLSVNSCRDRYEKANSNDADADRFRTCRHCEHGARHSGRADVNPSPLRGATVCARCHRGATRLIGKHLCISCQNREYEVLRGRNAKGTTPVNLAPLGQRSITYRTDGAVKTRERNKSVDMTELVVAVLRDESSRVAFGFRAPSAMDWLLGDQYDRSIGDAPGDISVTPESVTENTAGVPAPVAEVVTDVECDAEPATSGLDMLQADPYEALRAAVDQLDTAVPVCVPGMSRRAARKLRQEARRQVRVSNLTVAMLRVVGAVRAPLPIVAPLPVKLYSPLLFAM